MAITSCTGRMAVKRASITSCCSVGIITGCERTGDGKIRFTNMLGHELGQTGELPAVPADTEPRDWLAEELGDLEIGPDPGVTQWRGERIDWPLAVGHLFDR